MKRIIFQLAIVSAVILFLAQTRPAIGLDRQANESDTFQANCAVCHGADGGGSDVGKSLHAPDLRSDKVQMKSNAALARFISEGSGAMPAFKDRLDHQQILDEVRYLRVLGKHSEGH
jgi:cytochrome c6